MRIQAKTKRNNPFPSCTEVKPYGEDLDSEKRRSNKKREQTIEFFGRRFHMEIGRRLRALREAKHLSQGDIEKKTGLLRCYTSRVENGYTVPSVDTLEKYARALQVPLYRFFTEGETVKGLDLPGGNG